MRNLLQLLGITETRGEVIRQTVLQDTDLTRINSLREVCLVREGQLYRVKDGTIDDIDFSQPVGLKYCGYAPLKRSAAYQEYIPFRQLMEVHKK